MDNGNPELERLIELFIYRTLHEKNLITAAQYYKLLHKLLQL